MAIDKQLTQSELPVEGSYMYQCGTRYIIKQVQRNIADDVTNVGNQ